MANAAVSTSTHAIQSTTERARVPAAGQKAHSEHDGQDEHADDGQSEKDEDDEDEKADEW